MTPLPSKQLAVPFAAGIILSTTLVGWWLLRSAPSSTVTPPRSVPSVQAVRLVPPTGMETSPPNIVRTAAPAPAPSLTSGIFRLSGVVTQPGRPLALINGQMVYAGDTIDGARVVEITQTGVVLEQDDASRLTLYIPR